MGINEKLRQLGNDFFFDMLASEESIHPSIVRELPSKYTLKAYDFIFNHTYEELRELGLRNFIEQATGESCSKVLKLKKIRDKEIEIEKDFQD